MQICGFRENEKSEKNHPVCNKSFIRTEKQDFAETKSISGIFRKVLLLLSVYISI